MRRGKHVKVSVHVVQTAPVVHLLELLGSFFKLLVSQIE